MRRLWKKMHSESGASILLALLLFLVCCLVAATVLAAALSNAGKIRSNQAEQQKYLTLSSAIQSVAEILQRADYEWGYTVYEWDVTKTDTGDTEYYFYCEQNTGKYDCGALNAQLPLKNSLDGELKSQFPKEVSGDIKDGYKALDDALWEDTTKHTLIVTLPDTLIGYPYPSPGSLSTVYEVSQEVIVLVELNHVTHHITLTAWLGPDTTPPTDKSDTMVAELVAEEGTVPFLDYNNPEGRKPGKRGGTDANSLPDSYEDSTDDVNMVSVSVRPETGLSKTMKWKLSWIKKGVS